MNISSHRTAYFNACTALEAGGQYAVNGGGHGKKTREELSGRKDIKLTQSFLMSECRLVSAQTTYNFGVLDTQPNKNNTGINPMEQRLKQQDVFFCYELGFYVRVLGTPGGSINFTYLMNTYPDPNLFGGAINLQLFAGIWNMGRLTVAVNNNVITPVWDMMQHYKAPRTQVQGVGSSVNNLFNGYDYTQDGLMPVEPNWIINGGNNNQYILNYPETLTNMGTSSYQIYLCLYWRGFLAQNASSIMDAK